MLWLPVAGCKRGAGSSTAFPLVNLRVLRAFVVSQRLPGARPFPGFTTGDADGEGENHLTHAPFVICMVLHGGLSGDGRRGSARGG